MRVAYNACNHDISGTTDKMEAHLAQELWFHVSGCKTATPDKQALRQKLPRNINTSSSEEKQRKPTSQEPSNAQQSNLRTMLDATGQVHYDVAFMRHVAVPGQSLSVGKNLYLLDLLDTITKCSKWRPHGSQGRSTTYEDREYQRVNDGSKAKLDDSGKTLDGRLYKRCGCEL